MNNYITRPDGSILPYPIDTQLPLNTKTTKEIDLMTEEQPKDIITEIKRIDSDE